MANLLGENIGTNYKGILNLDTINTPLDATLRAVTDGEGNASPLQLSTDAVSVGAISGARLGIKGSGTTASTTSLLVQNSDGLELLSLDDIGGVRLGGDGNTTTKANIKLDAFSGLFNVTAAKFGNWNGSVYAVFSGLGKSDALFAFGNDTTTASTRMHIKGLGTTFSTTALLVQNSAGTELFKVLDSGSCIVNGTLFSGSLTSQRFYTDTAFPFSLPFVFDAGSTSSANTSGVRNAYKGSFTYLPTSGTGELNIFNASPTINQTGGANGITRGLFINPTLTAAADLEQ